MKGFWRRCAAVLTGCALMLSAAYADPFGLDQTLSGYLDAADEVRFTLSAQLEALSPYTADTVEMMNALLRHISLSAFLGPKETALTFRVAEQPVAELQQTETDCGAEWCTPLLPNRVLVSEAFATESLLGTETEEAFDPFKAIDEAGACYQELTDAILPFAEQKKANYSVKDVGTSRWSRIARLTTEQGAELAPLISAVLGCGMDSAYRARLEGATYAKGFVVALYQAKENGDDLAVYLKGDAVLADGTKRALSYQWAFAVNQDGTRTDTYKYSMKKSGAPRDDREITFTFKRSAPTDSLQVKNKCSVRVVDPSTGIATTTALTHDLKGKRSRGTRTVDGTVERVVKTTIDGKTATETVVLTPSIKLTEMDGAATLSGTVGMERKQEKNTAMKLMLAFDETAAKAFLRESDDGVYFVVTDTLMPESSLTQNRSREEQPEDYLVGKPPVGYQSHTAPKEELRVNMDALTEEERAALMDELTQNMAGRLLVALAKLPKEDTALLADNLSDANYAAFLELVQGLE